MKMRWSEQSSWVGVAVVATVLVGCVDGIENPQSATDEEQMGVAALSLSYEDPYDARAIAGTLALRDQADDIFTRGRIVFTKDGVRRAVALTNMVKGLQEALALYHDDSDVTAAVMAVDDCIAMLEVEIDGDPDDSFVQEVELLEQLVANMEAGGGVPSVCCDETDFDGIAAPAPGGSVGNTGGFSGDAGLGATPGGAQDIGFLRRQVDEGFVPLADHFAAEGLFSEHDLPLDGGQCDEVLCIAAAHGFAPDFVTGERTAYIQVGFSSGLDPATFARKPLNLSVVVDRSGSMQGDRIAAARAALSELIGLLGEDDRLSIVLFDEDVEVLLQPTMVTDRDRLLRLVETIESDGSTNIEAGLEVGFGFVADYQDDSQVIREDRVILITDAQPNVGATGEGAFVTMVEAYASEGIGLTAMGVGIEFGYELMLSMSHVRGANTIYLEDAEKLERVFQVDFDYLMTPLAYDLAVELVPQSGFEIRNVYGLPTWEAGDETLTLDVATVFVSRNRGAIVVELSLPDRADEE